MSRLILNNIYTLAIDYHAQLRLVMANEDLDVFDLVDDE
jgi:hypothetical protein